MINASEARKQARDSTSETTTLELLAAENSIKKAVDEGKFSCWCYTYLHDQAISNLKTLGYKIRDCSDQREGALFEIKWD